MDDFPEGTLTEYQSVSPWEIEPVVMGAQPRAGAGFGRAYGISGTFVDILCINSRYEHDGADQDREARYGYFLVYR